MASFALTRLRDGLLVLLLVTIVIFVLGHLVGNPAKVMAPVDATEEQIARLAHQLGLDRPFHEQFISYFGGLLRGDFGESLWQNRPALEIVLEALPATVLLTVAGIILAGLGGSLLGILAGARPGSGVDRFGNLLSVVALSVPNFWLGLLLIVVISVQLRALPTSGFASWQALVLPAVTLALVHGGRIFQLVRSATFEELTKPYVTVARSKGLPERVILWKHIFRNVAVTVATTVGWEYVRMMGGAAFAIEVVFAWPGIGQLMISAAGRQDFPLLQAAVIVAGAFVVLANLVVDLLCRLADRRLGIA
ncbi:MAG: ABC transporter permease [Sporichthyaceae bacterium]|nr:ABC transporter permease [Sporichthyaceae bacterium]